MIDLDEDVSCPTAFSTIMMPMMKILTTITNTTKTTYMSSQESFLPRKTRAVLSQIRSGHCSKLASYNLRVGSSDSDVCAQCNVSAETPAHLFSCAVNQTPLSTRDFWLKPWEAARFLSSLPAFANLPAVALLPPPPQRRRGVHPPPEPPPPT